MEDNFIIMQLMLTQNDYQQLKILITEVVREELSPVKAQIDHLDTKFSTAIAGLQKETSDIKLELWDFKKETALNFASLLNLYAICLLQN